MGEHKESNQLHIVMYHYTRDLKHNRYPHIKGMDFPLFREQIRFLNKMFHIVKMEEVISAVKGEYELPEDALLLTFDDGYIDNFTYVMPVLEEEKVQGSFFIPGKTFAEHHLLDVNKIHYILACAEPGDLLESVFERMDYYRGNEFDFPCNEELFNKYTVTTRRFDAKEIVFVKNMLQTVLPGKLRKYIIDDLFQKYVCVREEQLACELYMTKEQIRMLKRHGMYIGIHGYAHDWMANLPEEQMQLDIDRALDVMDEFIDCTEWVMNYPYGNYSEQVIQYIKNSGCCLGLTTEVREASLSRDHRYKIPRFDCNDFPPMSDNYKDI